MVSLTLRDHADDLIKSDEYTDVQREGRDMEHDIDTGTSQDTAGGSAGHIGLTRGTRRCP